MSPSSFLHADPSLLLRRPRGRVAARARRRRERVPTPRWLPLATVAMLVLGALGYLRMWPPLATVMSASMEPTINTGDMVVLKRLTGRPRVGQVVAVNVPDDARSHFGYPPVIIHRVIRVLPDGSVNTKGDGRKAPDPFVSPRGALTATVVGRIPAGGRLMAFLTSGMGLLWIGSGGLLFGALPILDRQREARRREEGDAVALRDQLAAISEELRQDRAVLEELRVAAATWTAQPPAAPEEHRAAVPAPAAPAPEAPRPAAPAPVADEELPAGDPLEQLALALMPEPIPGLVALDEAEPQLALALDVPRTARFLRPDERQLAFTLDTPPTRAGQLILALAAPAPAWDSPPPELAVRGGMVAASHFMRRG